MRLTGGEFRGRRLQVPTGARPTGSRLREALFSILGERVVDASFLDLFCGSGVVGLEALSRGASRVLFVDRNRKSLERTRRNASGLGATGWRLKAATLPGDLERLDRHGRWDIVFADPPYAFDAWEALLCRAGRLLASGGVLVAEHSSRTDMPAPDELRLIDRRSYGESGLSFFERRRPQARVEDDERS